LCPTGTSTSVKVRLTKRRKVKLAVGVVKSEMRRGETTRGRENRGEKQASTGKKNVSEKTTRVADFCVGRPKDGDA